jgi:hypothetical protein
MKIFAVIFSLILLFAGFSAEAAGVRSGEGSGLDFVASRPAFLVGSETTGANGFAAEHMLYCPGGICMSVCSFVLGFCWACVFEDNPNVSCPYVLCYSMSCTEEQLQSGEESTGLELE